MKKVFNILLGAGLLLGSEAGFSYVVYNESGVTLDVWGGICGPCFEQDIKPGDSGSCPGDISGCRGDTIIRFKDLKYKRGGSCWVAPVPVTNHGWVEITGGGNEDEQLWFNMSIWDNNGVKILDNVGLKEVSDGLFGCGS